MNAVNYVIGAGCLVIAAGFVFLVMQLVKDIDKAERMRKQFWQEAERSIERMEARNKRCR